MRAYVINMVRSRDRRVHMVAELQKTGIPYEFVAGVEGQDLDLTDPQVADPAAVAFRFRPTEVGCSLAHLHVYEKILADNLDWAVVLEDDVILPNDFADLLGTLAGYLTGAEVALLHFKSPGICKMSRQGLIQLPSARQLALPLDVHGPRSAAAYIITRDACKRMAECIVPFQALSDDWGHFFNKGALDRVRCVLPMPVRTDPRFASVIGYSNPTSLKLRVRDVATKYNISLMEKAIAYRRGRITRKMTRFELVDEPFVVEPSRLGNLTTR